jgi:hypothetical protein
MATSTPNGVLPTSIGQDQADIADGDETAVVGVDVLQIAVEHQELTLNPNVIGALTLGGVGESAKNVWRGPSRCSYKYLSASRKSQRGASKTET